MFQLKINVVKLNFQKETVRPIFLLYAVVMCMLWCIMGIETTRTRDALQQLGLIESEILHAFSSVTTLYACFLIF